MGDETGSGGCGTRNDIAVLWPPTASLAVLAVLFTREQQDAESDDALIAHAARTALGALTP